MGGVVQAEMSTLGPESRSEEETRFNGGFLIDRQERERTVSLPGPSKVSTTRKRDHRMIGPGMTLNEEVVDSDGFVDLGRERSKTEDRTPTARHYPTAGRIRTRLGARSAKLASQREALENSWAHRERIRTELESRVERDSQALRGSRAGSIASGMDAQKKDRRKSFGLGKTDNDRTGSLSGALEGGKKKHRGMGSRIRGMISSASSIHGGLSSMVGYKDERDRAKSQQPFNNAADESQTIGPSRMSLQIPSRVSPALDEVDGEETYRRPKMSNRLSLQSVPSRHHDGRRSPSAASVLTQEGDRPSGGLLSPTISIMTTATESAFSYTPTIPSTAPTPAMVGTKKFPTFRDLQDQSAAEMLEEETRRVQAGRKKEGLVWSPGIWEGIGVSSGRHAGDRKEKVKWESERFSRLCLALEGLH